MPQRAGIHIVLNDHCPICLMDGTMQVDKSENDEYFVVWLSCDACGAEFFLPIQAILINPEEVNWLIEARKNLTSFIGEAIA